MLALVGGDEFNPGNEEQDRLLAAAAGSGVAASGRASANLATLACSWATMFLAFCGPIPGSRRR